MDEAVLIAKGSSLIVDVILLVLTWKKTLGLHRESSELRMQTPLVRLLLVDGEPTKRPLKIAGADGRLRPGTIYFVYAGSVFHNYATALTRRHSSVFTSAQLASLLFSTVFFIRVSHVTVLQAEIVAVFAYFDPMYAHPITFSSFFVIMELTAIASLA